MTHLIEDFQLTGDVLGIGGDGQEKHNFRANTLLGKPHRGDLENSKLWTSGAKECIQNGTFRRDELRAHC